MNKITHIILPLLLLLVIIIGCKNPQPPSFLHGDIVIHRYWENSPRMMINNRSNGNYKFMHCTYIDKNGNIHERRVRTTDLKVVTKVGEK